MKKIYFLFLAIVFIISCNQQNNEKPIEEINLSKADTLTYVYESVEAESKNIAKTDYTENQTDAVVKFPKFANDSVNQLIKKQVLILMQTDEKPTSYLAIVNSFIKKYDKSYEHSQNRKQSWWQEIKLRVLYQQQQYMALKFVNSNFTGGAHPSVYYAYINFNPRTNQLITLDSLIQPNKRQQLVNLAESIFRKDEKLGATESLSGKYFFKNNKFALPKNFYIHEKGLVFQYNFSEIKPYFAGTTEIEIPFSELKQIAKPNTILTTTR